MAAHLLTRVVGAALTPLVHKLADLAAMAATTLAQLAGFGVVAGIVLILVGFAPDEGIVANLIKPIAVLAILVPALFSLMVVAEQIRITYAKAAEAVYPEVEVFEDREPM